MVDVQSFMMEPTVEGEEEGLEEEEGEEREALLNCHDQRRLGIVWTGLILWDSYGSDIGSVYSVIPGGGRNHFVLQA